MTDPLFPFEIRLHRDAFSVHKVHHVSLTDPVLADPEKVKAWHLWRQPDSLTASTKYKDWQRNSDNTDWLFLNAWHLDQEYADGQVPVADADGYFLPGDAGGGESAGPIDGAGTGGLIAKWADSNTLEDSSLDENASDITSTKPLYLPAGTTSVPSLRLPHGSAPTSPTNGDLWSTTTGFFGRVNGSTVGPFGSGGSLPAWLTSHPDAPPGSPDADDDEFHDESGQSGPINGLDAKWTWVNQDTTSLTFAHGHAVMVPPDDVALHMIVQPVPGSTWRIRCKVAISADSDTTAMAGLAVMAGTGGTDNVLVAGLFSRDNDWDYSVDRWDDFNTYSSTPTQWGAMGNGPVYLELEDDGTNILFRISLSGADGSFILVHSETRATHVGTPSHYGLVMWQNATAVDPRAAFDWFRREA